MQSKITDKKRWGFVLAKIIGDLGSEKALIQELKNSGIRSLRNLDDVENHIKNSDANIEALKEAERNKIREEIKKMRSDLSEVTADIATNDQSVSAKNPFVRIFQKYRYWKITRKQRKLEKSIEVLETGFESELRKRTAPKISEKESIDNALEQGGKWLIGARGERKVVQALARLPDSFIIINDVILHFKPPLRTDNGPRFKCQADHVVIGPTGVFNIETKYWSEKSVQNLDLRSPVEQIKITGKGLWRELNGAIRNRQIKVNGHHWGDANINVRNVLVMVGAMPNADFQMVKLLSVDRLSGYVEYFEPVFKVDEVESIVHWVTRVSPDSAKRSA